MTVIHRIHLCTIEEYSRYFENIQVIDNRSLFERFEALTNIIDKNIDSSYQNFLSQPIIDNSKISFYGKENHSPVSILSQLEGVEFDKYNKIKEETLVHYKEKINQLIIAKTGTDNEVLAEFLEKAIKIIDNNYVFCYDDMVVLGVWGMQIRKNINADVTEIVKIIPSLNPIIPPEPAEASQEDIGNDPDPIDEPIPTTPSYNVHFISDDKGNIEGEIHLVKKAGEIIEDKDIQKISPLSGFKFDGWDKDPCRHIIDDDVTFEALFSKNPEQIIPWYKSIWNKINDNGCFAWLIWILLAAMLLAVLLWLLKGCNDNTTEIEPQINRTIGSNTGIQLPSDRNEVNDTGDIYYSKPTESEYLDILPPNEGFIDTSEEHPQIVPGNPSVLKNRLNILMENNGKTIMEFARAFKNKYPGDEYQIVYYDNDIKRMQIEFPEAERNKLKNSLPSQFAPEYMLFIYDESLFESRYIPNDPSFKNKEESMYFYKINAPQAWDITQGSDNIIVAIVDNGFNLNHPEFKSKVLKPYNSWTHNNHVFPQIIDHGTHVAGIAVADTDNNMGICGIAPKCSFMPIQVADKGGLMTITSVLDGILFGIYHGADVINVSLGSQFSSIQEISEKEQKLLMKHYFKEEERLWREIMKIADKNNCTIVLAAGNDNTLAGIDAIQRPEKFIKVSTVDDDNGRSAKASFSNYGPYVTVSAPGTNIYSTYGEKGYLTMSGTSTSAPIVSGSIALMKSIYPELTNEQIIYELQTTGTYIDKNIGNLIQLDKVLERTKQYQTGSLDSIYSSKKRNKKQHPKVINYANH